MLTMNKYFTLKELIDRVTEGDILPYGQYTLKQLCTDLDITFMAQDLDNINIQKLWTELYARFYKEGVIKVEFRAHQVEADVLPSINKFKSWVYTLLSVLNRTFDYYNTLLNTYESAKNKLMDDVKSTSTNTAKYNDTPQSGASDLDTDPFITNITKNEGETRSELSSKIMRINEIQNNYRNTLHEWTNEYRKLFFEI